MSHPRETHSRRSFLQRAASSIGLALSAPAIASIIAACETDETVGSPGRSFQVDINGVPELSSVGGITITAIDGLNDSNPVFISRVAEDRFAVFSAICTHQACIVGEPQFEGDNCVCPCHLAEYSPVDGRILQQPIGGSATDLRSFTSTFDSNVQLLTING